MTLNMRQEFPGYEKKFSRIRLTNIKTRFQIPAYHVIRSH